MKKLFLILIVLQISIFSLQAQTVEEEKAQLKQINRQLVADYQAAKLDDALSGAQKAVDLSLKIYGAESLETAVAYKNLGIIYRAKKKYKEAIVNLQKAVEIYRLKPEQNAKLLAQTLDELAVAFVRDGDEKKTAEIYIEALAIAEKAYGKDSKEILPFLKSIP
jgi:kinesin light chain